MTQTNLSLSSHFLNSLRGLLVLFVFFQVHASYADDRTAIEKLSVFGKKEKLPTRPGSAHVVSEKELDQFDFADVHQVLRSVPGVNIQEEDGFGLRPNIGLRGGHPHRSRKVVLMEDGVLIAPAPYSAPAAYYFPQMDKISSIEVFKGTPATAYGPNSIGGALNLVTRVNNPGLELDVSTGNFGWRKARTAVGIETWGDLSFDISRIESTGFKELQNRSDTGFVRHNFTLRWDKYFVDKDQNINFKFNWSDENSNETYAGLTDRDFAGNPYQRYNATERDKMRWNHRQYFLSYALSPSENLRTRLSVYRHNFARSWDKLNGFSDATTGNAPVDIRDVLNDPDLAANNYYYQVLRGDLNSGALNDVLDLGNNQRQYYSQGIQLNFDYELSGFALEHLFKLNYRFHQDGIHRFHESSYFDMVNGTLVRSASRNQETTVLNEGTAEAHTAALSYETTWSDLTMQSILRVEDINYRQEDLQTSQVIETEDEFLAPGIGLFYQAFGNTGFLAGVNKAFTPTGPGQAANVEPEEAINYELGIRHTGTIGAELIGFYSDYKNLLGTCTQSGGCTVNQLDQSFNGGKSEIRGVEFLLHTNIKTASMNFPVRWSSTYTQAEFKNSFTSTLNEWGSGNVISGDPIPYIPEWQSNLVVGWEWKSFSSYFNINYLGKMADQAVQQNRQFIKERWVLGLALGYQLAPRRKLKLRVDNLTNQEYAVSRRPFGLRPGAPLTAIIGFEYGFF